MSIDFEEQYDKIYRYCYFRLRNRQTAEDITQEAFLRYLEKYQCATAEAALKCLYTIARNLCIDEYRRRAAEPLQMAEGSQEKGAESGQTQETPKEEQILTNLAVRAAVAKLEPDEQELLLLRYVNEVPILTIGQMLGISRFAVYRRLMAATKKLKHELKKEGF